MSIKTKAQWITERIDAFVILDGVVRPDVPDEDWWLVAAYTQGIWDAQDAARDAIQKLHCRHHTVMQEADDDA